MTFQRILIEHLCNRTQQIFYPIIDICSKTYFYFIPPHLLRMDRFIPNPPFVPDSRNAVSLCAIPPSVGYWLGLSRICWLTKLAYLKGKQRISLAIFKQSGGRYLNRVFVMKRKHRRYSFWSGGSFVHQRQSSILYCTTYIDTFSQGSLLRLLKNNLANKVEHPI